MGGGDETQRRNTLFGFDSTTIQLDSPYKMAAGPFLPILYFYDLLHTLLLLLDPWNV